MWRHAECDCQKHNLLQHCVAAAGVLFGPLMISGLSALYQLHARHLSGGPSMGGSPAGLDGKAKDAGLQS